MSAMISFHGPYTYDPHHYPAGTVPNHPEPYSSLGIQDPKRNDVTLYFHSRDELDAHIKAALAARDQWPGAETVQAPAPQCLSCGATEDLAASHVPAREGIAARTEHYCHDTAACYGRRHGHLHDSITAAYEAAGAA